MIRIILNGKKADIDEVRDAVAILREESHTVEVRVTWEHGDAIRFVQEASSNGVKRIVVAGGDGSINEVVNGLMKLPKTERPQLSILPLGTANDFAVTCSIPHYPLEALRLAIEGRAIPVDIVRANDRYFINVATGGVGTKITTETPTELKNFLGGGAYTISALIKALSFVHSNGKLVSEDHGLEGAFIAAAVCNGRAAGGGQIISPNAYINDGLMDVVVILEFALSDVPQVVMEFLNPSIKGEFVKRFQTKQMESIPEQARSVNLDGEPYRTGKIEFEIMPKEIELVLPKDCSCILKE
jgi:lipid kinase YegS